MKFISQSATKDMGLYIIDQAVEQAPVCPLYFYLKQVKREIDLPLSEVIQLGLLLEQGCLGGNAHHETLDIPRDKRTGKMKIKEKRTREHIQQFPYFATNNHVLVYPDVNTQVKLIKHYRGDWYLKGVLDVFPTTRLTKDGLRPCIIDQKFAGNYNNSFFKYSEMWRSGFCYGAPEFLAKNQGLMYTYLTKDIDIELNEHLITKHQWTPTLLESIKNTDYIFHLMIHDVSADITEDDSRVRWMPMAYNEERESLLFEMLDLYIEGYNNFEKEGWKPSPDVKRCERCLANKAQCPYKEEDDVMF